MKGRNHQLPNLRFFLKTFQIVPPCAGRLCLILCIARRPGTGAMDVDELGPMNFTTNRSVCDGRMPCVVTSSRCERSRRRNPRPLGWHVSALLGSQLTRSADRRRYLFDERIDEYALTVRCDVVRIGVEP